MMRHRWLICGGLLAALPLLAGAQARKGGNGLQGTYYQGRNFEQQVLTRRDPVIDFDWHQRPPAAGLPAEDFSVRWTGWLVPPTTGHYVLHLSVDDGIRLWLNGQELLNEWRGQSLSYYQLAVDLTAGEPYALRLEYCQYALAARARLAWAPPPTPPDASRRPRLWRKVPEESGPVVIPARYLFSERPTPPPAPSPLPVVAVAAVAAPGPAPPAAPRLVAASKAALLAAPVATGRLRPRSYLPPAPVSTLPLPTPPPAPKAPPVAAEKVATAATSLAAGRAVTLRALYFEQGRADLLPAVQASLDTLAAALAARPALRLEVQGHTDNQGDPFINQQLSRRRAEAVCGYLATRGVAATRLRAVGYGGTRPVADNRHEAERPRNRRVVLRPL